MSLLFEYAGAVRGELRYFAVHETPGGVLQALITRNPDKGSRDRVGDSQASVYVFHSEAGDDPWQFVAGLGYREMASAEVPVANPIKADALNLLRADADALIERGVEVLEAVRRVELVDA